ncbi:MAG: MarR family winged helix-turn-helix transcriptional regulator [Arachnia sp.]
MTSSIPPVPPDGAERFGAGASTLTHSLREVLNSFNELQRHVAHQLNLGLSDVAALEHLMARSDLGPADLASLLRMTTASATVLVDRLENAGHVRRQSHPQDRRRKQLLVTEHAQGEVFRALQPLLTIHSEIDKHYDDQERAIIESYLQRVSRSYVAHIQGNHGSDDTASTSPPEGRVDMQR